MGHKGKNFLVLVIVLFLVSIACNLPRADTPRGSNIFNQLTQNADHLYCDLIGGQWYLQNPADPISWGRCNEPYNNLNQLETPYGEKTDAANEDIPQLDEKPIQEDVIEAPTEEVPDAVNESQNVEAPSEETAGEEVTTDDISGSWAGTAQWLTDNNPPCEVNLNLNSNGTLTSTIVCPSATLTANGSWSLIEGKIDLFFTGFKEVWTGSVVGAKMSGTFVGGESNGVWSVTKK